MPSTRWIRRRQSDDAARQVEMEVRAVGEVMFKSFEDEKAANAQMPGLLRAGWQPRQFAFQPWTIEDEEGKNVAVGSNLVVMFTREKMDI
jgi:hypothetical protein